MHVIAANNNKNNEFSFTSPQGKHNLSPTSPSSACNAPQSGSLQLVDNVSLFFLKYFA